MTRNTKDYSEDDWIYRPGYYCEHREAFEAILRGVDKPVVWCAWGNLIEKRGYLKECLRDLVEIGDKYGVSWVCAGVILKRGHPHHPLYLKRTEIFNNFSMTDYIATKGAN